MNVKEFMKKLEAHPPKSIIRFEETDGTIYKLRAIEQTFAASDPQSNVDYTTIKIAPD